MRPEQFQTTVIDLCKNFPGVQHVQTLEEAGETRYPYGFVVATERGEARWQLAGQLADGEQHDTPAAPAEGAPAAYTAADKTTAPDGWLAGVIGASRSPLIETISVWSAREDAQPGHYGMTVRFYNGQRAFLRKI
ncbi:hypothetical protein ACFUEN_44980 [Streptomyces griseorubiginosus]|uniref:hypothetical protein n=1 Tax=Streptomyces griseorubiginosus TaxID=67304 RepID=UPI00362D471E